MKSRDNAIGITAHRVLGLLSKVPTVGVLKEIVHLQIKKGGRVRE